MRGSSTGKDEPSKSSLPALDGKAGSTSNSIGDGGIKMKSNLTREGRSSNPSNPSTIQSPADQSEENKAQKSLFSPNNQSVMNNFFNTKGPIKPQSMLPV